jgi:hypothetical protein
MKRRVIGFAILVGCLGLVLSAGCRTDDDDGDSQAADDDLAEDDDDEGDDDDDNNDGGDGPYDCEKVASGLWDVCGLAIVGIPEDEASLQEWCGLSADLFVGEVSPFWECMADCVFLTDCAETCFESCMAPPDPGGAGCSHSVHLLYSCGVVFSYTPPVQSYYIPEMDAAAACTGSMSELPWDCYGQCVATLTCSDPPTSQEANAMIGCLDACP